MSRRSLIGVLVVLCFACGREARRPAATEAAVLSDLPEDGGTLIRRLDVDILSLNPVIAATRNDAYVANYLFTPLIYIGKDLQPVPGLATSWEISEDGLVYRFELDKRATFSDGTPVRASDVIFTLRRIVDPASEAVQFYGSFRNLDLERTRALGAHTLEVAFREPLASQLIRFTELRVLPEHFYSTGDFRRDFNDRALGSGPYRVVRREPGKEVVLRRRPDFWGTRPHIETIVFKVITDHGTAWNAVKRGDIDETMIGSDTWLRERNDPALAATLDFRRFYTLNYNYIAWNTRDPLLRDSRVRRAFAMCVPVDVIVRDLYHGTARAMSGPFTPDDWAFNPNVPVIRYDPDGARRTLAEAGWIDTNGDGILDRGGKRLGFDLVIMSGSATARQIAQMLQAEMKNVGIAMEIVMLDGATALERLLAGNYQATYLSWDLDPDPDPYALFHSTQMPPRGQNFVFYSDPRADRLIDAGRREFDRSKRRQLYWQLHELLSEAQPYTWLIQVSVKWAINKRVRGIDVSHGPGLFLWYPGELAWWIPREHQTLTRQ